MKQNIVDVFDERVGNNIVPIAGLIYSALSPEQLLNKKRSFQAAVVDYRTSHSGLGRIGLVELERRSRRTDWTNHEELSLLVEYYHTVYERIRRKEQ